MMMQAKCSCTQKFHVVKTNDPTSVLLLQLKMASERDKLEELEDRLESFIEDLRAVGVIAGNFQQSGQTVLNERLYVIIIIHP